MRNQRIGITGGAGFIGYHLVNTLLSQGAVVKVLDLEQPIQFQHGTVDWIPGDVREMAAVRELADCSVIFNLAAESNVMRAEAKPQFALYTSLYGAQNVLALRHPFVVHASSREVYGEPRYVPVDEYHALDPKNVYGESKKIADDIMQEQAAVLRLANVIGTNDPNLKRVLPAWLTAAAKNESLTIYGGEQTIDFVPVEIVVQAMIAAAKARRPLTANIRSGISISLLQLVQRIQQLYPDLSVDWQPARPQEVAAYLTNPRQMQTWLRIRPPQDPLVNLPMIAAFYAQLAHGSAAA